MKDDAPPDPEQTVQFLHTLRDVTGKVDEHSRLKPVVRVDAAKKAASGTLGDIVTWRNTSSSGSMFTSAALTASLLMKMAISLDALDGVLPPPKRVVRRTPSTVTVPSTSRPATFPSNCGFAPSSKALASVSPPHPQYFQIRYPSQHMCAFLGTPTTQRGPPSLGVRRRHNLTNSGFPSSRSRYATKQPPYATLQAMGQKQVVQTPESPPNSMPELDKDDSDDDSDEEDKVDALEVTMR
ncbi:hypothetical protein EDB19DRAFT_1921440 [Suillus lakei]|nr:hypothetical protein EDB19DRAFT_1921440 [Suillus lakei]